LVKPSDARNLKKKGARGEQGKEDKVQGAGSRVEKERVLSTSE
jgi:hypothetical protein